MRRTSKATHLFWLIIFTLLSMGFAQVRTPDFSADSLAPFGAYPAGNFQTNISFDKTIASYVFEYQGEQTIRYVLSLNDTQTQRGLIKIGVQMDSSDIAFPVSEGGTRYRNQAGDILEPRDFAKVAAVQLTSNSLENNTVYLSYKETYEGVVHTKTIAYTLQGKTLVFHISSDDTNGESNYYGFSFGQSEQTPQARFVNIPYAIEPIVVFGDRWFSSVYLDRTKSNSVEFHPRTWLVSAESVVAYFDTASAEDTQGKIAPLNETGYITVSSQVMDVLPKINNPSSPYREILNDKVVLDLWEVDPTDFNLKGSNSIWQASRKLLESFHEYGLYDLAVIYHEWQWYGHGAKLPVHFPADPDYGTLAEFQKMIDTAQSYGYLFALHENYADMYQTSPKYNAADLAKSSDSSFKNGWFDIFTQQQGYFIAGDKAIKYAEEEGQQIKQAYDPNATYLDVNTGWPPTDYLDLSADNPNEKTTAAATQVMKTLFLHQKNLYQGPLFGEGGVGLGRFDTYYAGYVDGVERTIDNNYLGLIMPDFELQAVKPLMVNQGMGYYGRYFIPPNTEQQWLSPGEADWDLYRASEIAYGHAGFISNATLRSNRFPMRQMRWVMTEYYMLRQLQEEYLSANLTNVKYESNGQMVSLNQALIDQIDFLNPHLSLQYDNGLNLLMNFARTERSTTASADFGFRQGVAGWSYQYWNSAQYKEMKPDIYHWTGNQEICMLWNDGGHPGPGCDPVRTWISPDRLEITVTGQAYDLDPNCGNGVAVSIFKNTDEVWAGNINNGDSTGVAFELKLPLEKGDQLYFQINARGNADCDSTRFDPTIIYQSNNINWEVSANGTTYLLPSTGWVAWNAQTGLTEYSALVDGQRVDYAETPQYLFARGRTGQLQTIGRIATDGAVALVNSDMSGQRDLHMTVASQVLLDGQALIATSQICDLNLIHVDEKHIRFSIHKINGADTVSLTLADLPDAWLGTNGKLPTDLSLQVWQIDSVGQHKGSELPWKVDAIGAALVMDNLVADQWYEIDFEAGRQPPATSIPVTATPTETAVGSSDSASLLVIAGITISTIVVLVVVGWLIAQRKAGAKSS